MKSSTLVRMLGTVESLDLSLGQRELLKRKLERAAHEHNRREAKHLVQVAVRFSGNKS